MHREKRGKRLWPVSPGGEYVIFPPGDGVFRVVFTPSLPDYFFGMRVYLFRAAQRWPSFAVQPIVSAADAGGVRIDEPDV